MSLGCFKITDTNVKGLRNNISRISSTGNIPEKQQYLKRIYEETMVILDSIDIADEESYIAEIDKIVEAGLIGTDVDTTRSIYELELVRDKISIKEGKKIKESYIIKLGLWALALGVIPMLIIMAFPFKIEGKEAIRYANVWAGCMVGTWISYTARRVSLDFNDLQISKTDKFEPLLKLVFMGVTTLFVFLIIETGLINITFGNIGKGIMTDIRVVFLFGGFCGLLDSKIPTALYKKAGATLKI